MNYPRELDATLAALGATPAQRERLAHDPAALRGALRVLLGLPSKQLRVDVPLPRVEWRRRAA